MAVTSNLRGEGEGEGEGEDKGKGKSKGNALGQTQASPKKNAECNLT
jgi:hypothetical protein